MIKKVKVQTVKESICMWCIHEQYTYECMKEMEESMIMLLLYEMCDMSICMVCVTGKYMYVQGMHGKVITGKMHMESMWYNM